MMSTQENPPPNASEVSRVAFRAPPFWKTNPELWFLQLESQFVSAGITVDLTKFHMVVSVLDCDVLSCVSDIVRSPPTTAPYNALKDRIIEQYADSETARLKALLQDLQLGDKKPSQLLMQMRTLAQNQINTDVLKTLFLQRLPVGMQQILSVCKEELNNLALVADKIAETSVNSFEVNAVSTTPDVVKVLEAKVERLSQQLDRLLRQNAKRFRSRSRSRSPASVGGNGRTLCWYHRRFAEQAHKCISPCSFQGNHTARQE